MTTVVPIPLAPDVVAYIRAVFDLANERVTARLDRMPTTHEETLDFAVIDALAEARGPHLAPSGTVVDIDAHFVGGGWHWNRWEIADLGLIVNFRRADTLLRTKVVLLQSKRLYPREAEFTEDLGLTRPGGFGSLMQQSLPATIGPRVFRFDTTCRYRALQVGDDQWQAIAKYESEFGLPVHYMLYHPRSIPSEAAIPVVLPVAPSGDPIVVGIRVLSAAFMRSLTGTFSRNYAPAFGELCSDQVQPGTRLPDFMVDEVLTCREGYVADDGIQNPGLQRVFNQRTAPIAAAIRIDINLPEQT
jgi:hypothetical protein